MAISGPTGVGGTSKTATNTTSVASDAWTPTAGDVYVIEIGMADADGGAQPSSVAFSGSGLAITAYASATASASRRLDVYYAVASGSPTEGTLTVTWAGTFNAAVLRIFKYTGVDTTTPFVQNSTAAQGGPSTTPSKTMNAFGSGDNWTLGVFVSDNGDMTFTAGTGFTAEAVKTTAAYGGYTVNVGSEYQAAKDTSVDATWGTATYWGVIGLELKEAAAAAAAHYDVTTLTIGSTVG